MIKNNKINTKYLFLCASILVTTLYSHQGFTETQIKGNPLFIMVDGLDIRFESEWNNGKTFGFRGSYLNVEDFIFLDYEATSVGVFANRYYSGDAFNGRYVGADIGFLDFEASDVFGDDDVFTSGSGPTASVYVGVSRQWEALTMGLALGGKYYFLGDVSDVTGDGTYVKDNDRFKGLGLYWDFTFGWAF